ncbi:MAG: PKD domain-containing protein [Candidatus Poseidoniaceae archaeon]|nr:PKD domain-containing protein [Candidatus Poseidoniaceae archaeon]
MKRHALLLFVVLLVSIIPTQYHDFEAIQYSSSGSTSEVAEVPTWRVGDKWIYAGAFDAETLIRENGVSASVGEINGDAEMVVLEILTMTVENQSTLVYKTIMTAEFDKNGVELDGYNGNLYIDFTFIEYYRVSDLASVMNDLSLDVKFSALGFINIDVADITISNQYAPPNEILDFPMRLGERWMNNYTQDTSWSGSSDYITPFPADESGPEQANFGVTKLGAPINPLGHTISYGGCSDSFEVSGWNDEGKKESYRWFCPAIRSLAWIHTEDDVGLTMDFRIKSYEPVASSGVNANSDPGNRDESVQVDLEFPLFSLDTNLSVWANTSTSRAGEMIEFRHERTGLIQSALIQANGSAHLFFDSGHELDASYTSTDHSSHGIIAWFSSIGMIGASTLTLDEDVVALDLMAVPDRAYIERNRSGIVSELNELTGWNVIPGDILRMELPVMNRGITTSAPASVLMTDPSGNQTTASIPGLPSLEQVTVELFWMVPEAAEIGNSSVQWTVIPGAMNSGDADSSNDHGSLTIFIGRIPIIYIQNHSAVLTQDVLTIDASASSDPDGGLIWCSFYIEYDDGIAHKNVWTTVWTADCILDWIWYDDGEYTVLINVVDEERDNVEHTEMANIINRPPQVRIIASRDNASSFGTISLLAIGNDSDSEDPWPGVVDVHWPDAQCLEGWYTHECTVTWNQEGLRRYTAVATDDDGSTSETSVDLFYNNIAPFDLDIELWRQSSMVERDQQGAWHVNEDSELMLVGIADDSLNDLDDLLHSWSLTDAAAFIDSSRGTSTSTAALWSESGEHNITLRVTDDDGSYSEKTGLVEVHNVVPTISGISNPLPIAEGQRLTLDVNVNDTSSDRESLQVCWDLDPGINRDEIGSADDDCDIVGIEFEHQWQFEGIYPVVLHVVDDDGARASEVVNVTVMNQRPRVKVAIPEVIYTNQLVELDASSTSDSENDEVGLDFMWDMDATIDSNGDGDTSNDVDQMGMKIKKRWNQAGEYQIVLRVADEDKKNPGIKLLTIVVVEDEGGLLDTVSSQVVGPDASILVQIMLGILGLLLIAFTISRFRPKDEAETWVDDDQTAIAGGMDSNLLSGDPRHSPPEYAFEQSTSVPVAAESTPVLQSQPEQQSEPEPPQQPTEGPMAGLLEDLDI